MIIIIIVLIIKHVIFHVLPPTISYLRRQAGWVLEYQMCIWRKLKVLETVLGQEVCPGGQEGQA